MPGANYAVKCAKSAGFGRHCAPLRRFPAMDENRDLW
jgi:hypothetical protein